MKKEKIHLVELGKLQAFLFGLIGIIFGILYSFGGFLIDTLVTLNIISTTETQGLSYGTILAFGALLGMPLIGIVIGFFLGIIEAFLYNLFAKLFGGIRINI